MREGCSLVKGLFTWIYEGKGLGKGCLNSLYTIQSDHIRFQNILADWSHGLYKTN